MSRKPTLAAPATSAARTERNTSPRSGRVFADHYFARELKTPAEVRRAVRYLLDNGILHGGLQPQTDACASAVPLVQPRTWLLTAQTRRVGSRPENRVQREARSVLRPALVRDPPQRGLALSPGRFHS